MKREKSTGPRTDPCGTPRRTRKERLLWFWKTTEARLSERKDWVQRAKQGGKPAEISLWKREGCQTESKALEKSIVARIVQEPGLGLLNPSEMDWERYRIWSSVDRPRRKPAWWGERMELDSRKKSRRDRMMRSNSFDMQEVREIGRKEAGESRGFPTLCIGIIEDVFQMERKECEDQERLKMWRRKSMPERGRCFSMG